MWPWMTFEVILYSKKILSLTNVSIYRDFYYETNVLEIKKNLWVYFVRYNRRAYVLSNG